jgi:hypothetical protein
MKVLMLFGWLGLMSLQAQTFIKPQHQPDAFWRPLLNENCAVKPGPEIIGTEKKTGPVAFQILSEDYNLRIFCLEADTACLGPKARQGGSFTGHPQLSPEKLWVLRYEDGSLLKKSDVRNLLKHNELPIPGRQNPPEK